MEVQGVLSSDGKHVSGRMVGVVRAVHSPSRPRPRGRPARDDTWLAPEDEGGSSAGTDRQRFGLRRGRQCCACHRCRRGLLVCFSREACAHTTHVLLALARGDGEPLGCCGDCPEHWRRELPSRLMYYTGPLVVAFALAGMSYSTYLGFTVVLPLLAPAHSAAWYAYGAACATLYVNCVFNYLAAALINPGTADSPAFKQLVDGALRSGEPTYRCGTTLCPKYLLVSALKQTSNARCYNNSSAHLYAFHNECVACMMYVMIIRLCADDKQAR
jgi:hypothetical protein